MIFKTKYLIFNTFNHIRTQYKNVHYRNIKIQPLKNIVLIYFFITHSYKSFK